MYTIKMRSGKKDSAAWNPDHISRDELKLWRKNFARSRWTLNCKKWPPSGLAAFPTTWHASLRNIIQRRFRSSREEHVCIRQAGAPRHYKYWNGGCCGPLAQRCVRSELLAHDQTHARKRPVHSQFSKMDWTGPVHNAVHRCSFL